MVSYLARAYFGEFFIRKLTRIKSKTGSPVFADAIKALFGMLITSVPALVIGWVIGFYCGKVTATITGLDWTAVLGLHP